MSKPIGPPDAGIAFLGITHRHTSGRVRAIQRLTDARLFGAWDGNSLLQPFARTTVLRAERLV